MKETEQVLRGARESREKERQSLRLVMRGQGIRTGVCINKAHEISGVYVIILIFSLSSALPVPYTSKTNIINYKLTSTTLHVTILYTWAMCIFCWCILR